MPARKPQRLMPVVPAVAADFAADLAAPVVVAARVGVVRAVVRVVRERLTGKTARKSSPEIRRLRARATKMAPARKVAPVVAGRVAVVAAVVEVGRAARVGPAAADPVDQTRKEAREHRLRQQTVAPKIANKT